MGHEVDVLAYPLGEDVDIPNVSIHRIPGVPFIRSIKMGPSAKKLLLDVLLMVKTAWWLMTRSDTIWFTFTKNRPIG